MPLGQASGAWRRNRDRGDRRRHRSRAPSTTSGICRRRRRCRPRGTLDFRDLADRRADRAGRRGDHDGLAGLSAGRCRAGRYRRSCRACRARRARSRSAPARIELAQAGAVGERIVCQPRAGQHDVALGESRIVRGDRPRTPCRPHDAADRRRGIGLRVAHAPAHVGIEADSQRVRSKSWPSPGFGTATSSMRKSDSLGSPTGRDARTIRLAWAMMVSSGVCFFAWCCSERIIPGRCEASNPEAREIPRCAICASEVWSFGPSRNDGK